MIKFIDISKLYKPDTTALASVNLEIAPGIYIYHLKSKKTGKEKMGKFAVIK